MDGEKVSSISSSAGKAGDFKQPPSPSRLWLSLKRRQSSQDRARQSSSLSWRRPKAKVLNEDEYVERVKQIIERDFFPELDEIRTQTNYLRAIDQGDLGAIKKIKEHHRCLKSPASWDTPQNLTPEEEEERDPGLAEKTATKLQEEAVEAGNGAKATSKKGVSLDAFLARHTSEDNDSFNEIQEEQRETFRRTHQWMFKNEEQKSIEMKEQQLALPSIEQQAENELGEEKGIAKAVDGWTYQNSNAIFYNPDSTPFTKEEEVERATKERQIVFENTRFHKNPWNRDIQKNNLHDTINSKKDKEAGKFGVDGKAAGQLETPQVNGFSLLKIASPSPLIHPSESPIMTWGEVESTPYRLEGCNTPLHAPAGTVYKIQDVPKRDLIAHQLAEKNSKFYRNKKSKAAQKAQGNIHTPSGLLTDKMAGMSPAAQRLATSKLGISLGTDKSLRASYSPSPMRTPGSARSQRGLISSSIRSCKTPATPKTPQAKVVSTTTPSQSSLDTNDLLNLPGKSTETVSKRPGAADFL